jgi:dUTP pyrophosphatase
MTERKRRMLRLFKHRLPKVAKFESVSYHQAALDYPENGWAKNQIDLPERSTKGSAGYDFYCPINVTIQPGETVKIPTFVRCKIADGWVLMMVPRSSLGFKYRLKLDNTIGVIDADYYNSDNEGHIMLQVTNEGDKAMSFKIGERMCQGIFLPFGVTYNDDVKRKRNGGIGSTGK